MTKKASAKWLQQWLQRRMFESLRAHEIERELEVLGQEVERSLGQLSQQIAQEAASTGVMDSDKDLNE